MLIIAHGLQKQITKYYPQHNALYYIAANSAVPRPPFGKIEKLSSNTADNALSKRNSISHSITRQCLYRRVKIEGVRSFMACKNANFKVP